MRARWAAEVKLARDTEGKRTPRCTVARNISLRTAIDGQPQINARRTSLRETWLGKAGNPGEQLILAITKMHTIQTYSSGPLLESSLWLQLGKPVAKIGVGNEAFGKQ